MKRTLVATGVSALALAFGATSALATSAAPAGPSASQSNATTQVLPIAVAAPVTAPVNASVPIAVLGSNGDTTQSNRTAVDGSASNNDTEQVIVQSAGHDGTKGDGQKGDGQKGDVASAATQSNVTVVDGSAANNRTEQVIVQRGGGSATQSNATTQLVPIAAAVPVTAPVNLSVPVALGPPALPALPLVGPLLTVVGGVLADPVGAVQGALADPLGTVLGTVGALGLPLPALPALPV